MGCLAHDYSTLTTQKPPQITNCRFWSDLDEFRVNNIIPAYDMARGTFRTPHPPRNHPINKLWQFWKVGGEV